MFRSVRITGALPDPLSTWCVTTSLRPVADAAAKLLGGTVQPSPSADSTFEVLTDAAEVEVVVDSPRDIRSEMKLWDRTGLTHHCDGQVFLADDRRRGTTCGCPASLAARRQRARSGRGPLAHTLTRFRLADAPLLGAFLHESLSWELAEEVGALRAAAARAQGPSRFKLRLTETELAVPGLRAMSVRRPVLDFVAPVTSALVSGHAACVRSVAEAARSARTVVQAVLGRRPRSCLGSP
ncbi:hypothetical protein [Streptacidiphilus sp. MAP12-20]|uniref:recombination directionality factor n=1 Tax=Streptacidiphilus sp. MAP12-20 TaxID=3156299 RepID=UPI0035124367